MRPCLLLARLNSVAVSKLHPPTVKAGQNDLSRAAQLAALATTLPARRHCVCRPRIMVGHREGLTMIRGLAGRRILGPHGRLGMMAGGAGSMAWLRAPPVMKMVRTAI
jgi:hypothetical protein